MLLFDGSKVFRRGACETHRPTTSPLGPDATSDHRADMLFIGKDDRYQTAKHVQDDAAPLHMHKLARTDGPTSLTSAASLRQTTANDDEGDICDSLQFYPAVAYYGILHELDICVDVTGCPDSHDPAHAGNSLSGHAAQVQNGVAAALWEDAQPNYTTDLLSRLSEVQHTLEQTVRLYGAVYYLATRPSSLTHKSANPTQQKKQLLVSARGNNSINNDKSNELSDRDTYVNSSLDGTSKRIRRNTRAQNSALGAATNVAGGLYNPAYTPLCDDHSSVVHSLLYSTYLDTLTDAFDQMCHHRNLCIHTTNGDNLPTSVLRQSACHHSIYLQMKNHPLWRDVCVMLAIEHARLVLFLSASSRATQQYFTAEAAELSLTIEWIAGATMVIEPALHMSSTDTNPVFVLWNIFVNLELVSTVVPHTTQNIESNNISASTAAKVQSFPEAHDAVKRDDYNTHTEIDIEDIDSSLDHLDIAIVSSLPLPMAQYCTSCVRLVSHKTIQPAPDKYDDTDLVINANTTTPAIVQRQYTWRLITTIGIFHSYLLGHLVNNLVQISPLTPFHLYFDHSSMTTSETYTPLRSTENNSHTSINENETKPMYVPSPTTRSSMQTHVPFSTGMTILRGQEETVLYPRGATSINWSGFSRMSSQAWSNKRIQQQIKLIDYMDDDDEDTVEYEFEPRSISYYPPNDCEASDDPEQTNTNNVRQAQLLKAEQNYTTTMPGSMNSPYIDTQALGKNFSLNIKITKMIEDAESSNII